MIRKANLKQEGFKVMGEIIIPQGYKSALNLHDTQVAIKTVKDYFQHELTHRLHLLRVTAPLFVQPETGLNDNLNGVEHPVSFELKDQGTKKTAEIVQSLAKWKRYALHKYGFSEGEGIYTDMNAIRQDEVTDNIHSVYVDQWDWEKIMSPEERNLDFLKSTVKDIYEALKNTEKHMADQYDYIETILPDEIFFITSQELEDRYPDLTPKEREYTITKEKGAVFIMQIGGVLASGERQDGRSPDYDDWSLNGDLIVYYPVLDIALELSSMGIRVNADALRAQLKECGCQSRAKLPFQKSILNGTLPQTIGGGIGQSRICMFFLRKAHIGEVQCSVWPMETREVMDVMNIQILCLFSNFCSSFRRSKRRIPMQYFRTGILLFSYFFILHPRNLRHSAKICFYITRKCFPLMGLYYFCIF